MYSGTVGVDANGGGLPRISIAWREELGNRGFTVVLVWSADLSSESGVVLKSADGWGRYWSSFQSREKWQLSQGEMSAVF